MFAIALRGRREFSELKHGLKSSSYIGVGGARWGSAEPLPSRFYSPVIQGDVIPSVRLAICTL